MSGWKNGFLQAGVSLLRLWYVLSTCFCLFLSSLHSSFSFASPLSTVIFLHSFSSTLPLSPGLLGLELATTTVGVAVTFDRQWGHPRTVQIHRWQRRGGGRIHQPLPLPRESHRLFTPYTCGSVGGNDGRGGSNGLFPSCARIWRWRRREGWIRQPLPLLCGSHHLSTPIPTTTTTMGLKRCRCGSGRGSGSTTTTRMSGGVELHQRGIRCWELAKRGSSGEDQVRVSALFYFVKVIEIRSVTWLLVKIMFSQAVSLWGPTEKTDFCVRSGHPYVKNQDLPRHLVGGSWPGQMRKPLFTVWKDFFLLVLQGTHTIF